MSTVEVSVVVPVYNPGPAIDASVDALLRPSMPARDLEIIFVDDGSTDETPVRLGALAAAHQHISVITIPNSGWPGRPRNVGVRASRGEYVQLAREKHYDVLRAVVGPDPAVGPDVRLTFVGGGPDRRRLRQVFDGTPTRFVGPVHGVALAQAYRAADVVAFTSTTDTVGLVLLEAAALGRPVVAVDTRASRDTLADYPRARLVAPDASAEEWRSALRTAARTTNQVSDHGLGRAEATDVLLDAYARVLARRGWQRLPG